MKKHDIVIALIGLAMLVLIVLSSCSADGSLPGQNQPSTGSGSSSGSSSGSGSGSGSSSGGSSGTGATGEITEQQINDLFTQRNSSMNLPDLPPEQQWTFLPDYQPGESIYTG